MSEDQKLQIICLIYIKACELQDEEGKLRPKRITAGTRDILCQFAKKFLCIECIDVFESQFVKLFEHTDFYKLENKVNFIECLDMIETADQFMQLFSSDSTEGQNEQYFDALQNNIGYAKEVVEYIRSSKADIFELIRIDTGGKIREQATHVHILISGWLSESMDGKKDWIKAQ